MANDLNQIVISHTQSTQEDFKEQLGSICGRVYGAAAFSPRSEEGKKVEDIIEDVRQHKFEAVAKYTKKFDSVDLTPEQFRIPREELKKAHDEIDKDLLKSIRKSIKNVRKYQEEIFIGNFKHPGIKYMPIEKVGICVPGASAPLPSTVIMCAVPAQVAGVKEIAIVSPPKCEGTIYPATLAVCHELEIDEVYRMGGVQAVAALIFGMEKPVDKIVGPGNKWVQTAKKTVFGIVGIDAIDSIAGPSEVLIIANDKANPAYVAADMLSQAEHAPGSAILLTDSKQLAEKTLEEIKKQLKQLSRQKETVECLKNYSKIVVLKNTDVVIELANVLASEHLEIQCGSQSRKIADKIKNAGAIFIGDYSPVAVGDYWAGPSHTLPTGRTARFTSALSSNDFIKATSIIEYDREKLAESAEDIIRLAKTEGLDAHAKSIEIRQEKK